MHPPAQTSARRFLPGFLPGLALVLCALVFTAQAAKGPATADLLTEEEKAPVKKAAKAPAAKNPMTADLLTDEEAASEEAEEEDSTAASAPQTPPTPTDPAMDVAGVEREALARHPILAEKSMEIIKAEEQVRTIDMAAILPRLEVETGMGPAPGIRQVTDSVPTTDPNIYVLQPERKFDFSEWGPFFGVEATAIQPLNIARYRAGRRAAALKVRVTEAEFKKEQLKISEEAQTLYYQRLYALTLQRELAASRKDLDKAQKKMSDQLDDEKGNVSQTDVLQLKSGRYALDAGWNEASLGVARTGLAMRFLLDRPDTAYVALNDTVLSLRIETVPSLPDLKLAALRGHPDLSRLRNGLSAREELLKVAQGEIGPDIFLFANFKYSKAWSSDRQSGGDDPFARDPLNELTAVTGLGMRLKLNFWSSYQKYRKERVELRQLERTEVYAARGILLQLEDAYLQMLSARADVEEAQKSLRAADAWLKGAAMKYDLDPGAGKDLIGPFKQSLTGRRDYYKAVLEYNIALARVFTATGWTLSDFGILASASPHSSEPAKESE
jgi:outer membrane protein TolC